MRRLLDFLAQQLGDSSVPSITVLPGEGTVLGDDPWEERTQPDLWNEETVVDLLPEMRALRSFPDDDRDVPAIPQRRPRLSILPRPWSP